MFWEQINEPLVYILLAAALVSGLLSEWVEVVVILFIVLLNAVIGVIQEGKAEKALEALKKLSSPRCIVRRDGVPVEIEGSQLVVGDVVLLEAGRIVPADLRLASSQNLRIEESALTGESVPVEKNSDFVATGDIPLGDRVNLAFQGTAVTYGRGEGIVIATGSATEIGKIANMLENEEEGKTPLQLKLAKLGKQLGIVAILICALIFALGLIKGQEFMEMLLMAISLAVAAIPEGLTAVVTIVLALGVSQMVKRNAIIRRLPAVETLGCVNVICSDKTGTLTLNRMTVMELWDRGGNISAQSIDTSKHELIRGLALCNDASVGEDRIGDPTELALIDLAIGAGFNMNELKQEFPRVGEIPFDSERKRMTTLHKTGSQEISYTKGALDQMLPLVTHIQEGGSTRAITDQDKADVQQAADMMAEKALRVLALCRGSELKESDLTLIGLVGMIDPPREDAKASIEVCKQAGIRVVMITGDHKTTAFAIGRELGIAESSAQVISGDELDGLSDDELSGCVDQLRIFARVSPQHKVRIVKALKQKGYVVSMTGDGVNDAPSLKAADIGVAMGITGTDVAKGAADMILTDDRFSTIEHAVEQGRNIYLNIRKTVIFLLSSNFGEVLTVLAASLIGWASPLRPLHILWVNLVTDSLPALALGVDSGDKKIMHKKPRPQTQSLFAEGGIMTVLLYGAVIALATLVAFAIPFFNGRELKAAQTSAFFVLSVSQLFYSIAVRDTEVSILSMDFKSNKYILLSFAVGLLLQVAVVYVPPLASLFGTSPLSVDELFRLAPLCLLPVIVHEILVVFKKIRAV